MIKGMLNYCSESQRFAIGTHDLHCGDCFELNVTGKWIPTRIELHGQDYYRGWWLVHSNEAVANYEGNQARIP